MLYFTTPRDMLKFQVKWSSRASSRKRSLDALKRMWWWIISHSNIKSRYHTCLRPIQFTNMWRNVLNRVLLRLLSVSIVFVIFVWVAPARSMLTSPPSVSEHCWPTVHVLRGKRRDECCIVGIKHVHFHLRLFRRSLLRLALVLTQLRIHGVLPTFRRRQWILHTCRYVLQTGTEKRGPLVITVSEKSAKCFTR